MRAQIFVRIEQAGAGVLPSLRPDVAKTQSQRKLASASWQIDFPGQGNIAVFRAGVVPCHLVVLGNVLPAVGVPDKANRHLFPVRRAGKSQSVTIAFGQQQRRALVLSDPACVVSAAICQVGSQQGVEMIVGQFSLKRDKADFLQNHIPIGIGKDLLLDAITCRPIRCWSVCRPERRVRWDRFSNLQFRFSSEKKLEPSETSRPMSRVQA